MIISGGICLVFCGNFLLCYLKSKGQYDDYMEAVDKKEYGLKDFLPLGLWFCEQEWDKKLMPKSLRTV